MMRRNLILGTVLALSAGVLFMAQGSGAQDLGYWRAASNTANAITGDIAISGTRLTIDFTGFPLVAVRALKPAEVSAVFDADVNANPSGTLYRINIPATKLFLHRNTLCGGEDTEWMAAYASGKTLQVAFFSGDDPPVFTMDAISHSSALCGTYVYSR
ncbi:MAG TPA: hypothetical protein VMA34_01770 [Terracidiphilus sp.]|nr:hypothetical protein [Terracidiphilus sp.]